MNSSDDLFSNNTYTHDDSNDIIVSVIVFILFILMIAYCCS